MLRVNLPPFPPSNAIDSSNVVKGIKRKETNRQQHSSQLRQQNKPKQKQRQRSATLNPPAVRILPLNPPNLDPNLALPRNRPFNAPSRSMQAPQNLLPTPPPHRPTEDNRQLREATRR